MKNRVCIISCYMGELPDYFKAFLLSCKYNSGYDWLIITDDDPSVELPGNVRIKKMQLSDLERLIKEKIGSWAVLPSAYKLCDYKVAYGLLFEDDLIGYTHWGYGDIDVVYGELSRYITDEMLDKYDKVFPLGHLSIMKNNDRCKRAFMIEAESTSSYKSVYSSANSFYFDENKGINEKMAAAGMKVYLRIDFIDISSMYTRLRTVTADEVKILLPGCALSEQTYPQNYKRQIYVWDNGRLLRYIYDGDMKCDEYAYMHFRRRLKIDIDENCKRFIIGKSVIAADDSIITRSDIDKYNSGAVYDKKDYIVFMAKRYTPRIKYAVKAGICEFLYHIKPIRYVVRKMKGNHMEDAK
ncbi:MAG: hypothetical protein IJH37_08665 [Clostridia bacterium]|nr:hypothetical protein [Clostridia bacterium]